MGGSAAHSRAEGAIHVPEAQFMPKAIHALKVQFMDKG